jgi:hypothetical protein
MKVEVLDKDISINLDTYKGDDFYFSVHALSRDKRAMPNLTVCLCLDRAIEFRDKLSKIIDSEVAKINTEMNEPSQIATELAEVIDDLPQGVK